MSLHKKLIFLIVAIVITICAMGFASFNRSLSRLDANVDIAGTSFINRTAAMVDLFLDEHRAIARNLQSAYDFLDKRGTFLNPENGEMDEQKIVHFLDRSLETNKAHGLANIFIINSATGKTLYGTGWRNTDSEDIRKSTWYKKAMDQEEPLLTDPYRDPVTGQVVFSILQRTSQLSDGTGGVLLGFVVDLSSVQSLVLSQHPSGKNEGVPFFIDRGGRLWSNLPGIDVPELSDQIFASKDVLQNIARPSSLIPEELAILGKKMTRRERGWGKVEMAGRHWRLFYAPTARSNLVMGYLYPQDRIYAQLYDLIFFTLLSVVLTIGFILFFSVPISKNLRRSVNEIRGAAHSIKSTFGRLSPVSIPSLKRNPADWSDRTRIEQSALSLKLTLDDIRELTDKAAFEEFREILGCIHTTLTVVAEQQEDLASYTEEIMDINITMRNVNRQLTRREDIWFGLLEISQFISTSSDFKEALKRVADSVKNVSRAYGVCILILEGEALDPIAFSGYREETHDIDLEVFRVPLNTSPLTARALSNRSVQWFEDVHAEKDHRGIDDQVISELAVPLLQGARILGVMVVSFDKRFRRNEDLLTTLIPVGTSLSGYLATWRAQNEIRSSYEYLMHKFQEIADIYHHETASHLIRVGRCSAMAAAWLGNSFAQQQDILVLSRTHDLGKIRIPKEIVIKPGPLTVEEFELIKQHPQWGAELIGDAEWLTMARNICLTHHEKWDGSGYPQGLKGEEIPQEGRIVALVDVYDALRFPRSYKGAYTHEEALRIIFEGDGRTLPQHFDPDILAFLRSKHEEMERVYNETQD